MVSGILSITIIEVKVYTFDSVSLKSIEHVPVFRYHIDPKIDSVPLNSSNMTYPSTMLRRTNQSKRQKQDENSLLIHWKRRCIKGEILTVLVKFSIFVKTTNEQCPQELILNFRLKEVFSPTCRKLIQETSVYDFTIIQVFIHYHITSLRWIIVKVDKLLLSGTRYILNPYQNRQHSEQQRSKVGHKDLKPSHPCLDPTLPYKPCTPPHKVPDSSPYRTHLWFICQKIHKCGVKLVLLRWKTIKKLCP